MPAAGLSSVIAAVTDNVGNNYAEAVGTLAGDNAAGSVSDIWYVRGSKPGATALTITPSSTASNAAVVVWEFSGVNTDSPLDASAAVNSQPATTSPQGPSVTTKYSSEVVVSLAIPSKSITSILAGNAFTNDSIVGNGGWAHLITTSGGSYSAQWNQVSSGTFAASTASFKGANATAAYGACDLNQDSGVNVVDVQLATNMDLGLRACTANIAGAGVCSSLVVDQIRSAALNPPLCSTANAHSVMLSWGASSTANVGYNVYRSASLSGPYTRLTLSEPISGLSYIDSTVSAGQTYYYQVTSIDGTGESSPTTAASAAVPFP